MATVQEYFDEIRSFRGRVPLWIKLRTYIRLAYGRKPVTLAEFMGNHIKERLQERSYFRFILGVGKDPPRRES